MNSIKQMMEFCNIRMPSPVQAGCQTGPSAPVRTMGVHRTVEVILGYMPVPPDFKYMDVYLKGRPKHEDVVNAASGGMIGKRTKQDRSGGPEAPDEFHEGGQTDEQTAGLRQGSGGVLCHAPD